jgi:lactate dehydrogenase-like 2-hydroxyacid dehydrogenase
MMAKPALLMTGPMMPLIMNGCDSAFAVHRLWEADDREALLGKVAPEIKAICTGGHTGVKTDDALMGRFPNLKIVGNFGVGYDSVDAMAAAKRGIVVTNTPEVLTEEVADTTLGLLLSTVREFYKAEKWLRDGLWAKEGDYRLTLASLRDRSVGIVGLGRIGKAIARRLEAFGLPVSYFGRNQQADVSITGRYAIVAAISPVRVCAMALLGEIVHGPQWWVKAKADSHIQSAEHRRHGRALALAGRSHRQAERRWPMLPDRSWKHLLQPTSPAQMAAMLSAWGVVK